MMGGLELMVKIKKKTLSVRGFRKRKRTRNGSKKHETEQHFLMGRVKRKEGFNLKLL